MPPGAKASSGYNSVFPEGTYYEDSTKWGHYRGSTVDTNIQREMRGFASNGGYENSAFVIKEVTTGKGQKFLLIGGSYTDCEYPLGNDMTHITKDTKRLDLDVHTGRATPRTAFYVIPVPNKDSPAADRTEYQKFVGEIKEAVNGLDLKQIPMSDNQRKSFPDCIVPPVKILLKDTNGFFGLTEALDGVIRENPANSNGHGMISSSYNLDVKNLPKLIGQALNPERYQTQGKAVAPVPASAKTPPTPAAKPAPVSAPAPASSRSTVLNNAVVEKAKSGKTPLPHLTFTINPKLPPKGEVRHSVVNGVNTKLASGTGRLQAGYVERELGKGSEDDRLIVRINRPVNGENLTRVTDALRELGLSEEQIRTIEKTARTFEMARNPSEVPDSRDTDNTGTKPTPPPPNPGTRKSDGRT
jgi:hypothetical protein